MWLDNSACKCGCQAVYWVVAIGKGVSDDCFGDRGYGTNTNILGATRHRVAPPL